jgi:hypothetical protein
MAVYPQALRHKCSGSVNTVCECYYSTAIVITSSACLYYTADYGSAVAVYDTAPIAGCCENCKESAKLSVAYKCLAATECIDVAAVTLVLQTRPCGSRSSSVS